MKTSLADITVGGMKYPPRIVAYGVDGIGKSTFGSQATKPIFVCTEDGASHLDVPQFPLCKSWNAVFNALRVLAMEKHDYQTVVIDTADWAQHLAIEHIIKDAYGSDQAKFDSYGAGYKFLVREWRELLKAMDYLRTKKMMEIILLLHAAIRPFSNPLGNNYDIFKASLVDSPSTSIWGLTKEWADIVLFMNTEVKVRTESQKATKGKATMMQKRYIFTKPSAAYDAKVRAGWDLPDKIELSYETFKSELNRKNAETESA